MALWRSRVAHTPLPASAHAMLLVREVTAHVPRCRAVDEDQAPGPGGGGITTASRSGNRHQSDNHPQDARQSAPTAVRAEKPQVSQTRPAHRVNPSDGPG